MKQQNTLTTPPNTSSAPQFSVHQGIGRDCTNVEGSFWHLPLGISPTLVNYWLKLAASVQTQHAIPFVDHAVSDHIMTMSAAFSNPQFCFVLAIQASSSGGAFLYLALGLIDSSRTQYPNGPGPAIPFTDVL